MEKETFENYKEKAKKLYKSTKGKKNLWKHVKTVEKIAMLCCNNLSISDDNKYAIYLGCILHDIGRTSECYPPYTDRDHNKTGKNFLIEKFFEDNEPSAKDKRLILNMVKYHKGKEIEEIPQDGLDLFAIALVRFADKIANGKILVGGKKYKA